MDFPQPVVEGWYSSKQIQDYLGCSRQRVYYYARKFRWNKREIGRNATLYDQESVSAYFKSLLRSKLAEDLQAAPRIQKAIKLLPGASDYDIVCPKCGGFAIQIPNKGWRCENGHKGV